jgi:transketolase
MPSTDVFDAQPQSYRESVLPSSVRSRVAVEAGVTDYWYKYLGFEGKALGVDTFGESAPCEDVFEHFGLTVENVVRAVEEVLSADAASQVGAAAET